MKQMVNPENKRQPLLQFKRYGLSLQITICNELHIPFSHSETEDQEPGWDGQSQGKSHSLDAWTEGSH